MNKFDKLVKEDILNTDHSSGLDVDSIISGTQKRIRRRRNTRRVMYSSPAAVAIVALVLFFTLPGSSNGLLPGDELIMAGLEYSSLIIVDETMEEEYEAGMIDAEIDYITNIPVESYGSELDEVLTEEDIEAFYSYLKEV